MVDLTHENPMPLYCVEMELPTIEMWSTVQATVTSYRSVADAHLKDQRTQRPACSFRLVYWVPKVLAG